jgi:uncharacterized phage infection (PIP) family protein YhgE
MRSVRVYKTAGAVLLAAGLLVSACGSDGGTTATTATTTTTPTVCADVATLKTDIASLASIDVVSKGTDALKASLATIQADFDQIRTTASADAKAEVDALNTAMDDLKSSVDKLGSGTLTLASAKDAISAAVATASAGTALVTKIQSSCP